MYLVLSASLHPESRSRILARAATEKLEADGHSVRMIDLREMPMPLCDGGAAYGDANVQEMAGLIKECSGIIVATPIYNYDVNAVIKNLLELTGRNWIGKTVGFLCAAGGRTSYMSVISFANSLMLDFRCLIVPRFVYAEGSDFEGNAISEPDVQTRIEELTGMLVKLGGLAEPAE